MNWKEKCKKGVVTETGVLLRNLHAKLNKRIKDFHHNSHTPG